MSCCVQLASILLKVFVSVFIRNIDAEFYCYVLLCLVIRTKSGLIKWIWEYPLLSVFWKNFWKGLVLTLFKCLIEFTNSTSGPGLFLLGRYLITDSIFLLVINLLAILFPYDPIFVGCMFLRMYPIPSRFSNLLAYNYSK